MTHLLLWGGMLMLRLSAMAPQENARIFRIPPHMVGDLEKSSFSNIEQQSLEFVKYTLDPWAVWWQIQNSLFRIHPVVITRRIGGNYSPSTIYPTKPTKYIDIVGNKW